MQITGAKKGQKAQQKPQIAKDDLVSTSYFHGLYGLCEGEIAGLADGGKSIRLDGTPLINDNGQPNFTNVDWQFRTGTLDQEHIAGFGGVENERAVGVELRHDRQFIQRINNTSLSAVRVRLNFNALREQKDNGDITGFAIEYAVDVQTDGGVFAEVLRNTVRGKASQGFKKSHRIELPKANKNWTIRIRRITPNRDSELIADTVHIDALTEIIDAKLRYPATALLGITYDAATFSNIAKLAVRLKGKLIQVPTNYDPVTRSYTGLWDGTFKLAYSNNPAWVLYDICTHRRYGLGERLSGMVDKWRLYQIAQYCDELVDDGKGGQEPRFAINVYIQKDEDAYKVIQNIASVFRGLSYWDGTQVVIDSDTPKDPVYTFSPANVIGGEFSYTGTRARDRHSVAKVAWDNPDNEFKTEYEIVRNEAAIAKYGIRMLDLSAFGCTSQAQAWRAGLWALQSEQLETRTVSFKTGLQGFIPQVGQVINIADNAFAGRAVSGKIINVSDNQRLITLDRRAGKVGDTLTVNGTNGVQSTTITHARTNAKGEWLLTVNPPIDAEPEAVWAIISDELRLMQFRILTIAQNDDATFSITALQYEAQKYDAIDSGAVISPQPITAIKAAAIAAPTNVTLTANTYTHQGQALTTLTISWEQVTGAVAYIVKWRRDDGNWQTLPKVSAQSVDIDGVYSGNYLAEVQAVDAFDSTSLATTSKLTKITGKQGKPPRLARLTATGKLFGMDLSWAFNAGSDDTNYTEIEVSPDGRANIATLGTFAYPTDKHEITGLQGNLRQFYRARIVDKLGNTSDWTAWTSGTTEAQADKVLDLLNGQITQSQLHTSLGEPIAKIAPIEQRVNEARLTLFQEKTKLASAIRDISSLQSANNAKTQEIANLTQTVHGQTGQIRELGITTGDLTQKYSELKTANDNASSQIAALNQTNAAWAASMQTMESRFDNMAAGGRNLLRDSNRFYNINGGLGIGSDFARVNATANNQPITLYNWTKSNHTLKQGEKAVVSFEYRSQRWLDNIRLSGEQGGETLTNQPPSYHWKRAVIKFTASRDIIKPQLLVGIRSANLGDDFSVRNYQLERGNIATDYTQAPEDIGKQLGETTATINELKQTQATKDTAMAEKLSQLESSLGTKANTTALDSLATKVNQVDNKITAEARKVSQLQTDLGSKASTAQLNELSNKVTQTDNKITAEARKVNTLQTTVNGQTASVQTLQQSLNGISAQYVVKVDAGNRVAGFGLANNGGVSDFAVRADKFYIAPPTGSSKGNAPFVVKTSSSVVNGITVPSGVYIDSAFIANGSIDNAKIANAAIT
ncbi:hypothetical protein B0189_11095, partial [Moraxella cuniculi]|uniref:TipJ family phage tail tip protein n=1 Tax=Moraxella cuniculi TaxID=34061 RepID=UPI0009942DE3